MQEKTDIIKKTNASDIIDIIFKYKSVLAIMLLIIIVITVIMYIITPPKYKTTAILFPTASSSVSQSLLTESQQSKGLLRFGDETNVEQLVQIAYSDEIRDKIIEKFDLFKHYKIDTNSKYPLTKVNKIYASNIKITKTENMAVKIDVFDNSPDTCAFIADQIIKYIDTIFFKVQRERATKAFYLVEKEYFEQKQKLNDIKDSLLKLSDLGIIDVRSQTEMFSEQLAIAIAQGKQAAVNEINKKLDILAKYGNIQLVLREQLSEDVKRISVLEAKYKEAKIDMEQDLPNTYIVSAPFIPEKKDSPKLLFMLFVNIVSGFILGLVILLIIEKIKYIKNLKTSKNEQ